MYKREIVMHRIECIQCRQTNANPEKSNKRKKKRNENKHGELIYPTKYKIRSLTATLIIWNTAKNKHLWIWQAWHITAGKEAEIEKSII